MDFRPMVVTKFGGHQSAKAVMREAKTGVRFRFLENSTLALAFHGTSIPTLVPQVYLRVLPGDLDKNGALMAGANVDIKLQGDFVNTGGVAGRKLVSIEAGNIHNLSGGQISGQQVGLRAAQDINIIGSRVSAADAMSLKAGGNITVASAA